MLEDLGYNRNVPSDSEEFLNSPEFRRHLGLDFLLLLELDGRQHSVSDVFAFRVVEHLDVVEHILASFIA